ncbi:hypothetical protein WR25_05518 isoform E, partial [Diploscapter pachys]
VDDPETGGFVLRPGDFLTPKFQSMEMKEERNGGYRNVINAFNECQEYLERFWKMFQDLYLTENENFQYSRLPKKAENARRIPQCGEVVLIKSDKSERLKWKLGRIVELIKGTDDQIRSAKVRVFNPDPRKKDLTTNIISRTINLLIPLEVRPEEQSKEKKEARRTEQQAEQETKTKNQDRKSTKSNKKKKKEEISKRESSQHRYQTRSKGAIVGFNLSSLLMIVCILLGLLMIPVASAQIEGEFLTTKKPMTIPETQEFLFGMRDLQAAIRNVTEQEGTYRFESTDLREAIRKNEEISKASGTKKEKQQVKKPKGNNSKNETVSSVKEQSQDKNITTTAKSTKEKEKNQSKTTKRPGIVGTTKKTVVPAQKGTGKVQEEKPVWNDQGEIEIETEELEKEDLEEVVPEDMKEQLKLGKEEKKSRSQGRRGVGTKERESSGEEQKKTETSEEKEEKLKKDEAKEERRARKKIIHKEHVLRNFHDETEHIYIECTKSGVILWDLSANNDTAQQANYQVCTEEVCFNDIKGDTKTELVFPGTVTMHYHVVRWKRMMDDEFKIIQTKCPPKEFCLSIDCSLCLQVIMNPQCNKTVFAILVVIMCSLISFAILACIYRDNVKWATISCCHSRMSRICRFLCCDLGCGLAILWGCIKKGWRSYQRKREKRQSRVRYRRVSKDIELETLREKEQKLKSILKEPNNEERRSRSLTRKNSVDSLKNHRVSWSRRGSRSSSKSSVESRGWKPIRFGSIVLILTMIGNAYGCDEIYTITHNEQICKEDSCSVRSINEIAINPLQRKSCIKAVSRNNIVARLEIDAVYNLLTCQKGAVMYAFNSTVTSESKRFCSGEGLCQGLIEANDHVGYSYCQKTCGNFICSGCLSFSQACVAYKTFAKKNNHKIFELFRCRSWESSMAVKIKSWIRKTENDEEESEMEALISEGDSFEIKDKKNQTIAKVRVISMEQRQHSVMNAHFLKDPDSDTMSIVDGVNDKIALQTNKNASCTCKSLDLFKLTEDPMRQLPVMGTDYEVLKSVEKIPTIKLIRPNGRLQEKCAI